MASKVVDAARSLYPLITDELSAQSGNTYNADKWTLAELDAWKNKDFPATLRARYDDANLHVSKDELALLMDWKLAKGKFRPTLPKLIKSNEKQTVEDVSKAGYAIFMDYAKDKTWDDVLLADYKAVVKASLKKLCELRGVGPATGSLLLSLLGQCTELAPPFFSDEAFMYFIRDSLRPGQPIKYNVKEYIEEYIPVLFHLRKADNVASMSTLEKGAYSLKMYHIYRIDKLGDVKLPFEADDAELEKFDRTLKYLEEATPTTTKKRTKTETDKDKPKKRAKKIKADE